MLRTNVSTRPFYNQRAVRVAIAAVAALALALSIYNAARIVSLTARNAELSSRVAEAEARARELGDESRAVRESLNRSEVSATEAAAEEANLLIDRRAFSWTALFNRFEETLPGDVRITAVQPQVDRQGRFLLAIAVVSRSVEAVDAFIGELEKSGAFRTALPVQEQLQEDGTLRSVIQTFYTPSGARVDSEGETPSTAEPAPASESSEAPPRTAEHGRSGSASLGAASLARLPHPNALDYARRGPRLWRARRLEGRSRNLTHTQGFSAFKTSRERPAETRATDASPTPERAADAAQGKARR